MPRKSFAFSDILFRPPTRFVLRCLRLCDNLLSCIAGDLKSDNNNGDYVVTLSIIQQQCSKLLMMIYVLLIDWVLYSRNPEPFRQWGEVFLLMAQSSFRFLECECGQLFTTVGGNVVVAILYSLHDTPLSSTHVQQPP